MKRARFYSLLPVLLFGALLSGRVVRAATPDVAFLADETSVEQFGTETRAAYLLARRLTSARLLLRSANGTFVDTEGKAADLSAFRVVWYHQGDAILRTPLYRGKYLAALKRFASSGGGVLLSGGALAMVQQLRLETSIRPLRRELGNHREPAGIVPVERAHPAFGGLTFDKKGVAWISEGGCKAVADFTWGGPAEGMLLARTSSGIENPLAEYELGQGRIVVLGGRLPQYGDADNAHRANLERLTGNLLGYLGTPSRWEKVVVRSEYPPAVSHGEVGISPQRWQALRRAVDDLTRTFGRRYPKGDEYQRRLGVLQREHDRLSRSASPLGPAQRDRSADIVCRFESLHADALLDNPLLDFDRLLLIRRKADDLGLPGNFEGNASLRPTGYDNQIGVLSPVRPGGRLSKLYEPDGGRFVGDVDLHFDGRRMLFSMPDKAGRWHVHEMNVAGAGLRQLPLIREPDVDNYDACYLPDGRILFTSTAPFIGVPCVGGKSHVANLYLLGSGGSIRRLTVDQDHNWCPTVLNNGRVLYQRWEYADVPHAFYRLLFHMNPDGTEQMEYYGSNSYWPTAMFYARPIPNHPTRVVAVVGGHHDSPRMGELVILDPARGRQEADGAVQRIPGYGKRVEPILQDGLAARSWPRFLHPYPLSDPSTGLGAGKYFLVSCKPTRESLWGIYLVDVFDNFVLLREEPGYAMLEPIPLRKRRTPPAIADKVDLSRKDAVVFMVDVYAGQGLRGVPRGAIRALRVMSYEFAFRGMGGEPDRVGMDGPWDVRRILGTVPVEADGSACFRVPACTPISVQPLDAEGKAVQWMRSWFTAMPGETVSCVGCHEKQNTAPPARRVQATGREPSEIKPWYGPARGFSFKREVQPALDRYCVGCHNGKPRPDGRRLSDLTAREPIQTPGMGYNARFTPAYIELRKFVHTATQESDAHVLPPREFHADTSKLIQMLRKGHHGVALPPEAWDRLVTWIDFNAPAHGTWSEVCGHIKGDLIERQSPRRRELHTRYGGIDEDGEAVYDLMRKTPKPIVPSPRPEPADKEVRCPDWPMSSTEATRRQQGSSGRTPTLRVDLADGVSLELVRIPAGEFIMGDRNGHPDERPLRRVKIAKPFWLGRCEVTNRQFRSLVPDHDSGRETGEFEQFGPYQRGYPVNRPDQPVVRVSWQQAVAFCRRLSAKTSRSFTLPTEAQWEYACRAGTATPFWYGGLDDDFSSFGNVSDATHHAVDYPHVPAAIPAWRPADTRFDDKYRVSAPVGSFRPSPWGLYDMHGNVAEWTRSPYSRRKLPSGGSDRTDRMVVRGGSWTDRPKRCRSSFRLSYPPDQAVRDVGFRVVCE